MIRYAHLAVLFVLALKTPVGLVSVHPAYKLQLGRGQNAAVTQPIKIVRVVSGDPTIVDYMRFSTAQPTIGLRAGRAGVTNLLVWTSDSQVHTYVVTVR
jgi:Flp pilus assembly secretin CpaC